MAPKKGSRQTPEHRAKIGAANRGKKRTPEQIERIAAARRGYVPSEETRAKISVANWKGGLDQGYRRVFVGKGHPMANRAGYVMEHRIVMAERVGRMLTREDVVHHVNEDRLDNRIENLVLMTPSAHSKIHGFKQPFRGSPSPETRAKISSSLKGRRHSPERVAAIRKARWGSN